MYVSNAVLPFQIATSGAITINPDNTYGNSTVIFSIKGGAAQSADILRILTSGGVALAAFGSDGALKMGNDALIRRDVNAGLTASTTQSQGQGALTAEINEVATVANANDVVTLPLAVAGLTIAIINNGANTLQIFPALGDNLGAGVDASTTLAAGSNVVFAAYNVTNWEII